MKQPKSHVIRVDNEVYQRLQELAEGQSPYEETPNQTLRRLLGLEASRSLDAYPANHAELQTLLAEEPDMPTTATASFYSTLPMRTRRTVRHHNDPNFVALARAVQALVRGRFPGRFPSVVHPGSVSWMGESTDLPGVPSTADLTGIKLCFYGKEFGIFEDDEDRLDCAVGFRREMVDRHPGLAQLKVFDRRFQVPPNTGSAGAVFVGFAVANDPASIAKVKQVLDAM